MCPSFTKNSHLSNVKRYCGILSTAKVTWSCSPAELLQPPPFVINISFKLEMLVVFFILFPPTSFFCNHVCCFLNLNSSFPFYSPSHWLKSCYFFHQLHKNLSRFPSSQLALIFSSFEPHCVLLYFLWHLTHSTSCYGCLILSMNCDLLEGKYNMLTSPDEVIVKLSSRFFYFPLDILLMSCIKRCI